MTVREQYERACESDVYHSLPRDAKDIIRRITRSERAMELAERNLDREWKTSRNREELRELREVMQNAEDAFAAAMDDFCDIVIPILPEVVP